MRVDGEGHGINVLAEIEGRDGFKGEVVGVGGRGEGCAGGDLDWDGGGAGVRVVGTGILIGGGEVTHRRGTDSTDPFRSILY